MKKLLLGILSLSVISGCATVAKKQETVFGKEVIDVPAKYSLREVVEKTEESIGTRATNIQKFIGFMPDKLPEKPSHPIFQMKDLGFGIASMTFASISCGKDAVATISGQEPGLSNPYGTTEVSGYKACIYPYKNGYRVYIIGTYMRNDSNGIGGFLTHLIEKGVNKAICKGMSTFDCWWNQIVEKSKEEFKGAKFIEIEYPEGGKPVVNEDK
jgi:uncharacterized protein YceK